MPATNAGDRAGKLHWDNTWRNARVPLVGASSPSHVQRELAHFLSRWLEGNGKGQRLLEVGCGRSVWLPYLARELGYDVTGIDYSEHGCELARAVMASAGTAGQIVHADFLSPPAEFIGNFDATVSFGVAEHFDETAECISAFAALLRPGGRLITVVPNLAGALGFVQKHLNYPIYDKHVPLDSDRLREAHDAAGLTVLDSGYLISSNWGILSLAGLPTTLLSLAKRALVAGLARASMIGWMFETRLPKHKMFAAYVYCVADK